MRRILAIVCIFILLLFTGIPMFTSNLLCNQIEVYADTPQISDNEKIRAAITVYLNSKGAYLSSNGLQMDVVMGCMQENIDHFYPAYSLIIGSAYDAASLLFDIGISTSPLTVVLKAGAVAFFNQFLQWLIDTGKITNDQNNNSLYDGLEYGGSLFYIVNTGSGNSWGNSTSTSTKQIESNQMISIGMPVNGVTSDLIKNTWFQYNPNTDLTTNTYQSYQTVSIQCRFSQNYTGTVKLQREFSSNGTIGNWTLNGLSLPRTTLPCLRTSGVVMYSDLHDNIKGNTAWVINRQDPSRYYASLISYNATRDCYYISFFNIFSSSSISPNNAQINFNKENFDSTPTQEPGSDGLTYQPKQDGTGNTYNTYNDYYNDWKGGDTYIYYPSDPGGGGNDPGGGGDDPSTGGTSPPWDGSGSDGLYSTGGTLTPDGNGGYNLNFPDVGLPDLNIDWSINGLKEKFPFSIPWDLMAFFAVMNAEPETPEIQATIPLGIWEWDIDWDLHAFDNVARILRNMELIGFCIGLILITRSIIKG